MSEIPSVPKSKISKYIIIFIIAAAIILITYLSLKQKAAAKAKDNVLPIVKPKPKPGDVIPKTPKFSYNETNISALPNGSYPLVNGQKSKLVFLLQYALNVINDDTLALDGNFGKQTAASVDMQFGSNFVTKANADSLLQYVSMLPDIDPFVVFLFKNLK